MSDFVKNTGLWPGKPGHCLVTLFQPGSAGISIAQPGLGLFGIGPVGNHLVTPGLIIYRPVTSSFGLGLAICGVAMAQSN